ncbi:helix-turn-helix domain-containing protein [Salipaludibacillus aurantiacus]|uniref:Transcriptional regulator, contains XRE-family HTH domain n=1 Tax=Salipaludibacillus aurantiacus TaxID=1601833 RepID=A0A1H9U723_9BACI|nr:helix-turn-helix domain-containing protein [Salipaludibacillus aurantiacus]SES05380.1 Transcriptional regulator, contains XRE-family HTH domain [Salipaludibacillus aurantiacus]
MEFNIGGRIKDLRVYRNLSQKELAIGICSQAMISKIEKGGNQPSADVLYQIADRLGVDINYFFGMSESPTHDYVDMVLKELDKAIRQTNYKEALDLVAIEKHNPLFKTPHLQQILLWREGICTLHLSGKSDRALRKINQALNLSTTAANLHSEVELKILNTKAILLAINHQLDDSENVVTDLINYIETAPNTIDPKIMINIYFNASKNSINKKAYEEAMTRSARGIAICINNELLYLLGELYFQKGKSLYLLSDNNLKEALAYMTTAISVFDMTGNERFKEYVQDEISLMESSS